MHPANEHWADPSKILYDHDATIVALTAKGWDISFEESLDPDTGEPVMDVEGLLANDNGYNYLALDCQFWSAPTRVRSVTVYLWDDKGERWTEINPESHSDVPAALCCGRFVQ